jgi:hypothetical protein
VSEIRTAADGSDPQGVLFSAVEKVNYEYLRRQSEALTSAVKEAASRVDVAALQNSIHLLQRAVGSVTQAMGALVEQEAFKRARELSVILNDALFPTSILERIRLAIPAGIESIITKAADSLRWAKAQEAWERAADEYAVIMIKAEWPPVLDIPSSAVYDIVSESKSMSPDQFKSEITKFLLDFYDEQQLKAKLERWKSIPILSRRYAILQAIVTAHLEGRYELTVPVALIQMEGFLGDVSAHKGIMRSADVERYLGALFDDRAFTSPFDRVKSLILQNVLMRFEWGERIAGTISRHAIVHGADTEYGTESASLKCILLFDYLVYYYQKRVPNGSTDSSAD